MHLQTTPFKIRNLKDEEECQFQIPAGANLRAAACGSSSTPAPTKDTLGNNGPTPPPSRLFRTDQHPRVPERNSSEQKQQDSSVEVTRGSWPGWTLRSPGKLSKRCSTQASPETIKFLVERPRPRCVLEALQLMLI